MNRPVNCIAHVARMSRLAAAAVCGVCFAAAGAAPTAEETGADLAARNDAIVEELRQLREKGEVSRADALRLIRREISPIMDFHRLTGRAAGKYWRRASDDEKREIVAAFRDLLEGVYAGLLTRYSGQKVRQLEAKTRGDGTMLVGVEVYDGERSARLDYVFFDREGEMKIADVLVEGVSLLDTYRRQFAQIAKKDGVAGLAARLRELAAR